MPFAHKRFGGNGNITNCCKSYHKATVKFSSNPRISFSRKSTRKDPPVKSDQNKAISVHVLWGSAQRNRTFLSSVRLYILYFLYNIIYKICVATLFESKERRFAHSDVRKSKCIIIHEGAKNVCILYVLIMYLNYVLSCCRAYTLYSV